MNMLLRTAAIALATCVCASGAQIINEDFKLIASDAAGGDFFGGSVAVSRTTTIIGALFDDDAGDFSGSAYLFDTETGLHSAKLNASDGAADDQFGGSVAIAGTTAIVGASGNDDAGPASGSAYVFDTVIEPCPADITGDGQLNFFDVIAFLQAFAKGCP